MVTQKKQKKYLLPKDDASALTRQETQVQARQWFRQLRDQLCHEWQQLEQQGVAVGHGGMTQAGRFEKTKWQRQGTGESSEQGGGEAALMRGGVFEKVGVNISEVYGDLSSALRGEVAGAQENPEFWAAGISVVAHMRSPHMPAFHMNTRYIITQQEWFGGGIDMTPMLIDQSEEKKIFHDELKQLCHPFGEEVYKDLSAWCDEYFYLPHREETRGVGGIFYDHLLNDDDHRRARHWQWTQEVGRTFARIVPMMVQRHMGREWSEAERQQQCHKRGRYVEFNLLYDRGTRFGLATGGSVEAILMSLPPEAQW